MTALLALSATLAALLGGPALDNLPADAWTYVGPTPDQQQVWRHLADCEPGDRNRVDGRLVFLPDTARWDLNVGLYDGGLQWLPSTWRAWIDDDDPPYAWQADEWQEMAAAQRYHDYEIAQGRGGYGPWPGCARAIGLRT